jgi:hypothetical protein
MWRCLIGIWYTVTPTDFRNVSLSPLEKVVLDQTQSDWQTQFSYLLRRVYEISGFYTSEATGSTGGLGFALPCDLGALSMEAVTAIQESMKSLERFGATVSYLVSKILWEKNHPRVAHKWNLLHKCIF